MTLSLSPSSINTFVQCPLKWHFRYEKHLKGIPVDESYMKFGSNVHSIIEHFYIDISKNRIPTEQDVLDKIELAFTERYDRTLPKTFEKQLEKVKKNFIEYELERLYKDRKNYHPLLVEQKFSKGAVNGIIDSYTHDGIITDFKTGKKAVVGKDYERQATIYYWLLSELEVSPPPSNTVEFVFLTEGKTIPVTVTEKDIDNLISTIDDMCFSIGKKDFPARKSQLCRYCEYILECETREICIFAL